MDATVIELDDSGAPVSAANVILSPQNPYGVSVPIDKNFSTDKAVRWRDWDDALWDFNGGIGKTDLEPGTENSPIDFMLPYPASVLKVMVGFGVLQLVDQGKITLDGNYDYKPTGSSATCTGDTSKPVKQYFDEMITYSDNHSTCALIKILHDNNAIASLN
ncbi:conserved hypothetical protein [Renibacterium salmoninarum ATCC 33209]|uniref:Beta-lactamase class A catalytic domain-containing protein n=1 Tax=Renibacterium salmoninarum (strain ATCC 33209 / DSM 20767 / JCM 11484 / NBRC 15589 / NCIMB 2235) TaxID=288705 RepID=A9WRV9_RENSM|nr:serine hydrolase [Renibacterium salmoninarum]ABY24391.1 conserved hypothetical protein [Renibacterium salmoninarum ATCC 33209]